ncbi:BamA/TamA family outer membrane protein [candidate division WOR-3 bacterium]|nr:BamA/TamA family outer membrane protein [candidate division WOR-3 bacterium]
MLVAGQFGLGDTVEAVRFEGNRAFSGRALRTVVTLRKGQPLVEARAATDARLLERFYRDNGFRAAEVEPGIRAGRRQQVVTFQVSEGTRSVVAGIGFEGNRFFTDPELLAVLPVRAGDRFGAGQLVAAENAIAARYTNSGFPFAVVEAAWRFEDTLAYLDVVVEEGSRCHVAAVRVRGNTSVRTATILRAAEVRAGVLFRRDRLLAAQSRLYATRLFRRVMFYVLRPDSTKDSVVIRFDVTEQAYRAASFGGGFEALPWRALATVGWEHANLFNRGHQFEAGVEYSPNFTGDFRVSVDATYRIPYLILTRVDFSTHPFVYYELADTSVRREYGIETGLSRNFLPEFSLGLFNRFRLVADTTSGLTNSLALNATWDDRDDVLDSRRGFYLRAGAEAAGGLLGGTNDFDRLTGEARAFLPLPAGFVLAGRAMAGAGFPRERTATIPYYEAFTLGGRNSLRGYAERSLGPDSTGPDSLGGFRFGPRVLNTSLELRSPYIFGWVGFVAFADGGEVAPADEGLTLAAFEYSAGVGVRVRTPIGPVRVDWGKRLKDAPAGDRGRFYLGLLHAF